ncbi:MAG: hypothetical protein HRF46_02395 [Acidobacteriota bacterium]
MKLGGAVLSVVLVLAAGVPAPGGPGCAGGASCASGCGCAPRAACCGGGQPACCCQGSTPRPAAPTPPVGAVPALEKQVAESASASPQPATELMASAPLPVIPLPGERPPAFLLACAFLC